MDIMASKPKTALEADLLKFGIINEDQAKQLAEDREKRESDLLAEAKVDPRTGQPMPEMKDGDHDHMDMDKDDEKPSDEKAMADKDDDDDDDDDKDDEPKMEAHGEMKKADEKPEMDAEAEKADDAEMAKADDDDDDEEDDEDEDEDKMESYIEISTEEFDHIASVVNEHLTTEGIELDEAAYEEFLIDAIEGYVGIGESEEIDEDDFDAALEIIETYNSLDDNDIEEMTAENYQVVIEAFNVVAHASLNEAESGLDEAKRSKQRGKLARRKLDRPTGRVRVKTGREMAAGRMKRIRARAALRRGSRGVALSRKKRSKKAGERFELVGGRRKRLTRGELGQKRATVGLRKGLVKTTAQARKVARIGGQGVLRAGPMRIGPQAPMRMAAGVEATSNVTEGQDLGQILDSLNILTAPLAVESESTVTTKILEGFEKIRESASEIAERIAAEVKAMESVAEDSEVVMAGLFFEGLALDADRQARAFKRGELDESTALGDLGVLHKDLKKGIESLREVD